MVPLFQVQGNKQRQRLVWNLVVRMGFSLSSRAGSFTNELRDQFSLRGVGEKEKRRDGAEGNGVEE